MKPLLYSILLSLLATPCFARKIKIAVIDTGFDFIRFESKVPICLEQSKNIITNKGLKEDLQDNMGHGTHVAGLIDKYARYEDYCQVIVKNWEKKDPTMPPPTAGEQLNILTKSFKYAVEQGVDVINISGGGTIPFEDEREAVKKALDSGIIIVAASGNEKSDLSDNCNFFPACYDPRIVVAGSVDASGKIAELANYGSPIDTYAVGKDVVSLNGIMSGTSMAAAITSGIIIAELAREQRDPKYKSEKVKIWTSIPEKNPAQKINKRKGSLK